MPRPSTGGEPVYDDCRIGLVGHGMWTRMFLLPGLLGNGVNPVALCGRDEQRARQAADELGIRTVHRSVADMIESERLSALVVASPPAGREPIIELAARHGLAIFCEKPLGHDATGTAAMVAAARAVPTMVGFTQRWNPGLRALRDAIRAGTVGEPRHLRISYLQSAAASPEAPWTSHFDAEAEPYGVLTDLGPHVVDLVRWLVGEVRAISGIGSTTIASRQNHDEVSLNLRLESGAAASIVCSRISPPVNGPFQGRVDVLGSEGWAYCDLTQPNLLHLGTRQVTEVRELDLDLPSGSDLESTLARLNASAVRQMGDFLTIVPGTGTPGAGVRPDLPDFSDGHAVQRVVDAAGTAIESASWVDLGASEM